MTLTETAVLKLMKDKLISKDEAFRDDLKLSELEADSLDLLEFLFEIEDAFDTQFDSAGLKDNSETLQELAKNIAQQIDNNRVK